MFSVIGSLDNYREGEIYMCIMLCWMVEHDDYIVFRKVTLKCVRRARVKGCHILF